MIHLYPQRVLGFLVPAFSAAVAFATGCGEDNPPPIPPPSHAGQAGSHPGGMGQGGEGDSGQAGTDEGGRGGTAGGGAAGKGGRGHGGHSGAGAAGKGGGGQGGGGGTGGTHAGAGAGGRAGGGMDGGGEAGLAGAGGSFGECDPGFAPSGPGGLCTDIDECAAGACDVLSTCTNTEGSYSCGACPPEYTGSGADGCVPKPCSGDPGVECPCIKVTPDGDDALAVAHHGLSPFATVGAALDFAAENPHVATNVCVAGGAACPTEPLEPATRFAGPADQDLVMRSGISLYGSYESTGFTRCPRITTELDPAGARGVYFGPEVQERTRLDGFAIARAGHRATAGVTIDGASAVELEALFILDSEALIAATDTELITGIDVLGGSDAKLTFVQAPVQEVSTDPHGIAPMLIGVHARDSKVELNDTRVNIYVEHAQAFGVLLEDSPGSSIHTGSIRLAGLPPPEDQPSDLGLTAVRIAGAGSTVLECVNVTAWLPDSARADPSYIGLELLDGADAVVTCTHVTAEGGTGLRARNARVTMSSSSVVARYDNMYGVWLENSPGSDVSDITAIGLGAVGVHVTGDASGTHIGGVSIFGAAGIELDDCGGAAPLIDGSIGGPLNTFPPDMTGNAIGVHVMGDCHPRIENNHISLSTEHGDQAGNFEAIRCEAKNGVASRCVVKNNDIAIRYLSHPVPSAAQVAGVRCTGGSCAEVSSVQVAIEETFGCMRSCYREGYGVIYGGSTLVTDIGLTLTCGGGGTGCWDVGAPTLFVP